jgi:hypothetical protein
MLLPRLAAVSSERVRKVNVCHLEGVRVTSFLLRSPLAQTCMTNALTWKEGHSVSLILCLDSVRSKSGSSC